MFDLDDELMIELDDIDLELDVAVPGKVAKALPLTTPTIAPAPTGIDYREEVELTRDAGTLFDFGKTTLSPVQQMYIIGFAAKGTRKGACQLAGVPFSVVKKWMEDDEFSEALQNAVDIVRDSLEEELLSRAMSGSDRLLLEAVKAMKPEKYNKKQSDVNITGNVVHTWADLAKQAMGHSGRLIEGSYEEVEE